MNGKFTYIIWTSEISRIKIRKEEIFSPMFFQWFVNRQKLVPLKKPPPNQTLDIQIASTENSGFQLKTTPVSFQSRIWKRQGLFVSKRLSWWFQWGLSPYLKEHWLMAMKFRFPWRSINWSFLWLPLPSATSWGHGARVLRVWWIWCKQPSWACEHRQGATWGEKSWVSLLASLQGCQKYLRNHLDLKVWTFQGHKQFD